MCERSRRVWLLGLCLGAACGDPSDGIAVEDLGGGAVQLHPEGQSDEPVPEEGTPGRRDDGLIRIADDCVYVQWCNEDGPSGTICRLRDGCSFSGASLTECIQDAQETCGTPVTPWYLF